MPDYLGVFLRVIHMSHRPLRLKRRMAGNRYRRTGMCSKADHTHAPMIASSTRMKIDKIFAFGIDLRALGNWQVFDES
jgi:hypothetical protein